MRRAWAVALVVATGGSCAGESAPARVQGTTTTIPATYDSMPKCPADSMGTNAMHADFGSDTPGGPSTPEDALRDYLLGSYPRLAAADFVRTVDRYGYVEFGFTDPRRGQMLVSVEANGDSYRIPVASVCHELETWARGDGQ